jgi:hypothetical protein
MGTTDKHVPLALEGNMAPNMSRKRLPLSLMTREIVRQSRCFGGLHSINCLSAEDLVYEADGCRVADLTLKRSRI